MTYDEKLINAATTGQLQEMFEKLTGKATTDRNKGKLMARVLRLNAESKPAAKPDKPAKSKAVKPVSLTTDLKADAKPADKAERKKAIEKKVSDKVTKRIEDRATVTTTPPVKADPFARMRATAKPKPMLPGISELLKKGPVTVSVPGSTLDVKSVRRSRSESETCKTLSALKPGTVLEHNFRGGNSVRVTVETPCDAGGKGGVYKYKNKKYDNLRAAVLDASGIPWNVLLFFRLKPYAKHRKVERAEPATA